MEDKIAILLKNASLEAEKKQAPFLQSCDLSVSQYKFLKYLYTQPNESVRIADLQFQFSMTHPAVIDILKMLEKKGYTSRVVNPNDSRSTVVSVEQKAYDKREELEKLGDAMEEAVTRNLSETEKRSLRRLLGKMCL